MDEDLLATCAGLGYTEGDKYYRGEECWECAKDLISFLKLDDESSCTYRLQMATAHILQKDLLSVLVNFHEDERLMDVIIRLILNLTQPAQTCMNKHPTIKKADLMDMGVYMALNAQLRKYKEAFTVEAVFQVLGGILGKFCQKEYDKRTDDDIHLVERILGIIRNILHVPADPAEEKRTSDDVSVHDQIIWSLHTNGFFELFIYIASSSEEQDWLLYIAEIMFLMMREQNPSSLASALRGTRAVEEKEEDNRELSLLLERERAMKAKKSATYHSRHSRFLGTYTCTDVKGIGDRMLVYHKPLQEANTISFDDGKRGRKKSRNRRPAEADDLKRSSTLSIRKVLATFCVDFLKSCYNLTMQTIKSRLMAGRCQTNDETYYFWCLRFFMEFSRLHEFNTDVVSETLTMDTFNFIMKHVFSTFESLSIEKQAAARPWSKRLQYALKAYHELLQYVQMLSLSSNEEVRDNAKIMQRNIFYIPEYRDVFVSLLKSYDEVKSDKSFLADVVETVHLYLKLIERYCKDRGGRIMVQAKKKASKGRKNKSGGGGGAAGGGRGGAAANKRGPWSLSDDQMQELWEEHSEFATLALQSLSQGDDNDNNAIPFDAASELPEDVQRTTTAELIRSHLLSSAYRRAAQLFRAARDIWRDGTFGRPDSTVDEEIVCMRQIFFNLIMPDLAPEPNDEEETAASTQAANGEGGEGGEQPVQEFIGAGADDDEEEEGRGRSVSYDFEFNLSTYVAKFANFRVVRNYSLLLSRYTTNSVTLNHCIVKMMYRIAHDCQLIPLFFQLSVFTCFDRILNDPAAKNKHMVELYKFSVYIVRKFTECAPSNPVLYAEALFWKDGAAVFELQNGYGSVQTSKSRILAQKSWTDAQQEQLAQLYERFQGSADLVGDILVELEVEPERSRRQISHQLVKQGLVTDRKELHRKLPASEAQAKKSAQWADNDIVESGASASSSSDDDDVDTVLARLQNAADAGLLEENEVDSALPIRSEGRRDRRASGSENESSGGGSDSDTGSTSARQSNRDRRRRRAGPIKRPSHRAATATDANDSDADNSDIIADAGDSDSDNADSSPAEAQAQETSSRRRRPAQRRAGRRTKTPVRTGGDEVDSDIIVDADDSSSNDDGADASAAPAAAKAPKQLANRSRKQHQPRGGRRTKTPASNGADEIDSDISVDADDSSSDDDCEASSLKIDVSAAHFSSSEGERDEDMDTNAGGGSVENDNAESYTPNFASRRRSRIANDSSDEGSEDGSGEQQNAGNAKAMRRHTTSGTNSRARQARFADDSGSGNEQGANGAEDDDSDAAEAGESHTPSFATSRHARIADDSSEEDEEMPSTEGHSNDGGGGSHTPAFASSRHARIADNSSDDETPSMANGHSEMDGGESNTPAFAALDNNSDNPTENGTQVDLESQTPRFASRPALDDDDDEE
eukprot:scpid20136/ scgid10456/ Protein timeless homolog